MFYCVWLSVSNKIITNNRKHQHLIKLILLLKKNMLCSIKLDNNYYNNLINQLIFHLTLITICMAYLSVHDWPEQNFIVKFLLALYYKISCKYLNLLAMNYFHV